MKRIKKEVSVIVNMETEDVKVMVDGVQAANAQFTIDGTQIMVTSVDTEEAYRRCGYGRLLFDGGLKCIANQKKKPLILWASDYALEIKFYEKIGFLHLDNPEVQKRVKFGNVRKKDLTEKVDNDDFIWIPQTLYRRKPIIYL